MDRLTQAHNQEAERFAWTKRDVLPTSLKR